MLYEVSVSLLPIDTVLLYEVLNIWYIFALWNISIALTYWYIFALWSIEYMIHICSMKYQYCSMKYWIYDTYLLYKVLIYIEILVFIFIRLFVVKNYFSFFWCKHSKINFKLLLSFKTPLYFYKNLHYLTAILVLKKCIFLTM